MGTASIIKMKHELGCCTSSDESLNVTVSAEQMNVS